MKPVVVLSLVAAALWFVMFSPWTAGRVSFWLEMAVSGLILTTSVLAIEREKLRQVFAFRRRDIGLGLGAAGLLYGVFWAGNGLARSLFDFAAPQIASIYGTRSQASGTVIALLLLFIIGPAEEIFWRAFVQRRLSEKMGKAAGFALTVGLYTLVHLWSFNAMLLLAAAVCGVFWGLLYWRSGSIWPGLLSHALWDATIFVLLPIQ